MWNHYVCWHSILYVVECVSLLFPPYVNTFTAELSPLTEQREININVNVFLYCLAWNSCFGLIFMREKHPWNSWSETDSHTQHRLRSLMFCSDYNHDSAASLIDDISTVYFHFPPVQPTQQKGARAAPTNNKTLYLPTIIPCIPSVFMCPHLLSLMKNLLL